jgi:hypothetical protein
LLPLGQEDLRGSPKVPNYSKVEYTRGLSKRMKQIKWRMVELSPYFHPVLMSLVGLNGTSRTFGHYKAPAGNSAKQLRILKEKSNKLGQQVSTGPFDWNGSWTFYRSIYQKAMGYVLPQSFFMKAHPSRSTRRWFFFTRSCDNFLN